ncbi:MULTISPECIES: hypothetical protein [unclassified Natrinema]|uniref:hypothetical protein n=1 Tax=unclassified Natrinema TaxID=2622230 RepID=UPI00026D47E9|nr:MULTISPECIES: hypothetical protein [unclassified Natrinema]AFO59144.1 hypothetical protein NJ7G_3928 [Natrinema sp. J7-2]
MGFFNNVFGNDGSPEGANVPRHEHFPSDTYGPAYPVAVYQEDLKALKELRDTELSTPTLMELTEFREEIMADILGDDLREKASREDLSPH